MAQPTLHATGFTVSSFTANSITLGWTNQADAERSNYLILANTTGTFTDPTNGAAVTDDTNLGDGAGAFNVAGNAVTYLWNTGLSAATVYYFKIYPYKAAGGPTYLTTSAPTTNRTTLATEPANQATAAVFTNIGTASMDVGFTAAASTPTGYIVLRKTGASPTGVPVDGTTYAVDDVLGDATVEFVGAIGSIPFNDASLAASTTYHYDVISYNGAGAATNYNLTSPLEASRSTLATVPTNQPTALVFSNVTSSSYDIGFTAATGSPAGYLVVRKAGSAPTGTPTDGTTYAVNDVLGDGTVEFVGAIGSIPFNDGGLSTATEYFYNVYAYNGSSGTYNYLTGTAPLQGSRFTLATAPTNQATALVFSNVTGNSMDVGFTAATGSPDGYLVIRRSGASPTGVPVDGTTYAVDDVLGNGTIEFVGAIGSIPFNDASLGATTTYHYDVFSYNGSGSSINYLTASPLEGSRSTLAAEPGSQATAMTFTSLATTSYSVGFTAAAGSPTGYLVVRRTGASPTGAPVDGTTYAVNDVLGDGTVEFVNTFASIPFNDTGLTSGMEYFYDVFSYNGSGATINYLTTSPLEGNRFTLDTEPANQPTTLVYSNITTTSFDVTFTAAASAPDGYLVIRRSGSSPTGTPTDGTSYTAGDAIGDGVVAYAGDFASLPFSNSSLLAATTYHFDVFSYNGSGTTINYRTAGPLEGSRTTLSNEPTNQPTAMAFTSLATTSYNVGFTAAAGSPTGYLVVRRTGASPTGAPVDGTTYAVNDALGDGTVEFVGVIGSIPFNDAGLTQNTEYFYDVFSYNGSGSNINYLTTAPLEGNRFTLATLPANSPTGINFTTITTTSYNVNWTASASSPTLTGYIVLRRTGSSPTGVPTNGTTYAVNDVIGDGTVEFVGNAVTFNDAGLTANTTYHYDIIAYSGSGQSINYRGSPHQGSRLTNCLDTQASAVTFGTTSASSVVVNWVRGSGNSALVLVRKGAAAAVTPDAGTSYTTNTIFESGSELDVAASNDDYHVVYQGTGTTVTVTGLDGATAYNFLVYELNSVNTCYLTASPASGDRTTTSASASSTLTAGTGFATISSLATTVGTKVAVLTFTVTDTGDDGSQTDISQMIFRPAAGNDFGNWTELIAGVTLTDNVGTGFLGYSTAFDANSITISSIQRDESSNPDNELGEIQNGASKTYTLSVYLNASLGGTLKTTGDGQNFAVSLVAADITTDVGNSAILPGSVVTSHDNSTSNGALAVIATAINAGQQPSTSAVATIALATQPQYEARDQNGNRDLDFNYAITVNTSNPNNLGSNSARTNFISGVADFVGSGFNFPNTGTSTMTITANGITSAPISPAITVTANTAVVQLTGGIAPAPTLNSSATNQALLGFSLQTSGSALNFTGLTVATNVDPDAKIKNIELYSSTTNDYSTGGLTFIANGTTPGNAINFTGFTTPINTTPTYYFIVIDVEDNVYSTTPALQLTLTPNPSNVVVSTGSISGGGFSSSLYDFEDVTPPTISSITVNRNPFFEGSPSLQQTVTVVFSEDMQTCGACKPDISMTSSNWSSGGGGNWLNNTTYELVFTHNGTQETVNPETVTVSNGGNTQDAGGLSMVDVDNTTFVLDTKKPIATVTVSDASLFVGPPSDLVQVVTVTYDEAMDPAFSPTISFSPTNNFTAPAGAWTVGNTVWTRSFTHNGTSETQLTETAIVANTSGAKDVAGNSDVGDTSPSFIIDTRPPTINSISSSNANGYYTTSNVLTIAVNFNENIVVTGSPTLTLNSGGTATYSSTVGATMNFTYTVLAGHNVTDLDVTAFNLAGGTVKDSRTNAANLTLPGNPNRLQDLKNIVIDTTTPTIVSVSTSAASASYNAGDIIDIQVLFSEIVTVANGIPQLALNSGGFANYLSGTNTTTLTFRYSVAAGHNTTDLDYINTTSLTLPGTTLIRDLASINATLTLASPGAANSISDDRDIIIDTVVPTVSSITITAPTVSWSSANGSFSPILTWQVLFSEPVLNVDAADFTLSRAAGADLSFTSPVVVTGSGDTRTVTLNDVQLLTQSGTAQLTINVVDNNSITDVAGNTLGGALMGDGTFNGVIAYPGDPLVDARNDYYTVIFPEPSNAGTGFTVATQTPTNLEIQWSNPVAPPSPNNFYYFEVKKTGASFQNLQDGIYAPDPDSDFSDGTLSGYFSSASPIANVTSSYIGAVLNSGLDYNVRITSVNFSGSYNGQLHLDYLNGTTLTGNTNTTTATSATLASKPMAANINALVDTQAEAELQTTGNFVFDLRDESSNLDDAPLRFSALTIDQSNGAGGNDIIDWTQAIEGAVLSDGTTSVSTLTITPTQIIFPAIASNTSGQLGFVDDGTTKTYSVKIWLKSSLEGILPSTIDGLNFAFEIDENNFTLDNSVSGAFQRSTQFIPGQLVQSGAANNEVFVNATQLVYRTPGDQAVDLANDVSSDPQSLIGVATPFSASSSTQPKVYALDPNKNLDRSFTQLGNIDMPPPGANLSPSITSQNFVGGILNLSALRLNAEGSNGNIRVQSAGMSPALSSNVSTVISTLTQITPGGTAEPGTISSLSTSLTGAIFPQVNAVQNFDFTITDDAGANTATYVNNDGLPTRFNTLVIRQGTGNDAVLSNWNHVISQVYLTNGVTNFAGSINVAGDQITFSSIPNTIATDLGFIADGGAKTYGLKVILKGLSGNQVDASIRDLIDGKDFVFSISSNPSDVVTVASPANSSSILQASTADSGDGNNAISVTAARIDFTTQWLPGADQSYDADLDTDAGAPMVTPIAKAVDHNGNVDRGYTTDATIVAANPATFPVDPNPATISPTNGIYNIGSLKVTSAGGGTNGQITNLIMSSGALTPGNSNSFVLKYSGNSNIIRNTGFTHQTDILYADPNNQVADITNATGIAMEQFIMQDGGGASDADGTGTSLSSIVLNIENYQYLRRVALYDGATEIADLPVIAPNITALTATNANMTFNGITTFVANDNGSKTLTIKASFLTTSGVANDILDNKVVNFRVDNVIAGGVSSSFSAGGVSTVFPTLGADENALEVVTTKLDFTTQPHPTNISTFTDINNPYMVISARDANNNVDVDYTGTIGTVSNSLALIMTNTPAGTFTNGVYDFAVKAPNFQFESDGQDLTMTVAVVTNNQLGALPTAATSAQFDVAASFESWVTVDGAYTLPDNVPYITYQAAGLTSGNSFELVQFVISDGDADTQDGGAVGDVDGAPTILNSLTLGIANYQAIRSIGIFDENNVLIQQKVTADFNGLGQITFGPSLNIEADDDGRKMFRIRATFMDNAGVITDNIPLQLSIVSAALGGGSKFYEFAPGYIAGNPPTEVTAPPTKNLIEVTATRLDFTTQPAAIEGILQPLSIEPVVQARDAFAVVDLDFTNIVATISSPALTNPVNLSFTNGILNFAGVQYDEAGDGTYLVEASTLASNANGSTNSTTVDVLHVSARKVKKGVISTPNLRGGSLDSFIFGVFVKPEHQTNSAPSLNSLTFSFNDAYKTSSRVTFYNFRVYEATDTLAATPQNVLLTGATVTELSSTSDSNYDLVKVDWGANPPRDLFDFSGNPVGRVYYLQADVDVSASVSTPSLIPQLIDAGYATPTDNRIVVTEGSAMASVIGTEYFFASTRPPVLLSNLSKPFNGQLNVDKGITQIDLEFDVQVWSLDGKAELYERATKTKVANLMAINGNYVTQGGNLAPTAKPLRFSIDFLPGKSFKADSLYYVTIAKGSFSNNVGTGISDNGFNFYGGISSNSILYFKISSELPPALKSAQSYFANSTVAAFSTEFDQTGTAYYLMLQAGSPAPDTAQIRNPLTYPFPLAIKAYDSYTITQVNKPQTVTFGANLTASTTYDVWIFAKNDANPKPIGAAQPYGAGPGYVIGAAGPTLQISVPPLAGLSNTKTPSYTICPDSYFLLTEPIILGESSANSFQSGVDQEFNILAPSGFEFDGITKPTIKLIGPDFALGLATFPLEIEFINNTIINVKYRNTTAIGIDNIIITNLYMYGASGSVPSKIKRFAGNANIGGVIDLAAISTGTVPKQSFSNSYSDPAYTDNDFSDFGFPLGTVITAIPDNYVDRDVEGGIVLLPQITPANDYGPTSFIGNGITNDVLSLNAVEKDAAFDITMVHTDLNGCVSKTVVQYVVYDHTSPISEKLGDFEGGTKQAIINPNFPDPAPNIVFPNAGPRIDYYDLAGYALVNLYATIPPNAVGQIISGPEWEKQVERIPISVDTLRELNSPTDTLYSFQWDYNRILNASFENTNITRNPYDEFLESVAGNNYWIGGSLGKIQFVGWYQSTADFQVELPFIQEVEIFVPPIPLVLVDESTRPVESDAIYCENGEVININGYPAAAAGTSIGTFTLFDKTTRIQYDDDAFVDNGNGTAIINPATLLANLPVGVAAYDSIGIVYTFQENNSPVSGADTTYIRITPNPVASFTAESIIDNVNVFTTNAYCENKVIRFTSTSSIANSPAFSITEYAWDFGDVNAGGSNPNIANTLSADHRFIEFNTYNVGLIATSEFGCKSPVTVEPVKVGAVPTVSFSFNGVSTNDIMQFDATASTVSANDAINSLNWTFGDANTQANALTTSHTYANPGLYQVTARLISDIGCTNELIQPLIVTEYYAPADANGQYFEDFEVNGGNWQFFSQSSTNASWATVPLSGAGAPTTLDERGGTVWKTHANAGKTFASERSALYSGTLDMRNWTRPILIFDSFFNLATGDGVVFEYSTDNLNVVDPNKVWNLVGSIGTGVEWYNDLNLPGKPGKQDNNFYGWTGASGGWQTARHSLSELVGEKRVVFRVSLGSVSDPAEGFALDNVRIGNGTRTVLLENFTNTSPSGANIPVVEAENAEVNDFLEDSPVADLEVVKVNYHVAFPGQDPFNQLNPDDPGARALYYGISSIPQARLDGSNSLTSSTLFSQWGQAQFDARVLDLANADISINIDRSNPEADSIRVDFTPSIDVAEPVLLHVLVLEREVLTSLNNGLGPITTSETSFDYVLRRMLPNAAGTKFATIQNGQSYSVSVPWADGAAFAHNTNDNMVVVVFLQNESSRIVYQSAIERDLTDPKVITAVEQPGDLSFEAYPNPADQELVVTLPRAATAATPVRLYDQLGKTVIESSFEKGEQTKQLAIDRFASGIYILKIDTPEGVWMKKVMISHRQ